MEGKCAGVGGRLERWLTPTNYLPHPHFVIQVLQIVYARLPQGDGHQDAPEQPPAEIVQVEAHVKIDRL